MAGVVLMAAVVAGQNGLAVAASQACGRTWAIVPSPNPDPEHNTLHDVSAVSPEEAWAVGGAFDQARGDFSTLIEHWDGTSWSIMPSPNEGDLGNNLMGVAAASAHDAWAVGTRSELMHGVYVPVPLILHWDGSSWKVVPVLGKGTPPNGILGGVLALGPNDVWAAGSYALNPLQSVDFGRETLIEHWDGHRWSVIPSPNVPFKLANAVGGLAASGPADVWAVGSWEGDDTGRTTLIEHWDGSGWAIVESPNRIDPRFDIHDNDLRGAVTLSESDAWAVGEGEGTTLTAHWDGASWSMVSSPAPGIVSGLYATDALGPTDVVAVGTFVDSRTFDALTLAMRWDGGSWRTIATENVPGAFDNRLEGLAVTADRQFAVGTSTGPDGEKTLIEQRCP
ncbi:MAG TPA: hypothetical protein VGL18_10235 [Actinomycetota bacterium]